MVDIQLDFKEAIIKYNIKDLIDIEKKLYLISLFIDDIKMQDEFSLYKNKEYTIFKEITFMIQNLSDEEDVIIFSGTDYRLSKFRRIINFLDCKSEEKSFIYNDNYFQEKLNEKKIKLFEPSGPNISEDSKDSLNSEFDEIEISNLFSNESITEIKKIETNTNKLLEKFKSKPAYANKISDLSLNMKYYNKNSLENEIEYYNDLIKFKNNKILNFFVPHGYANILYIIGQKGCGKTTHLLFSSLDIHIDSKFNYPRLYIDYRFMKENSKLRKLIFKQEMFYMTQTVEELCWGDSDCEIYYYPTYDDAWNAENESFRHY